MVTQLSNKSVFELRAYLSFVERSKSEFLSKNSNCKKGSLLRVELDWYNDELARVKSWLLMVEGKAVRDQLNAKSQKFLNPKAGQVVHVKPKGFGLLVYNVKQFCKDFWRPFVTK